MRSGKYWNEEPIMSRRLIVAGSLLHIGFYLYAVPQHAIDPAWPDHAQFHIVQAIFWVVGLDLTAAMIAFFLLPSTKRWARFL